MVTGKVSNPTVGRLRTCARALGPRPVWSVGALDERPTGGGGAALRGEVAVVPVVDLGVLRGR